VLGQFRVGLFSVVPKRSEVNRNVKSFDSVCKLIRLQRIDSNRESPTSNMEQVAKVADLKDDLKRYMLSMQPSTTVIVPPHLHARNHH